MTTITQASPEKLARRAKHRKPNRRPMLPLWAGALMITLQAKGEMEAATKAQLSQYAQHGAL